MKKKLAIVTTHPIQYNAPLFKLLAERRNIQVKVFYTWGETVLDSKYDPGFGKAIEWDIPLLEGYEYCFVKNVAVDPGSHHFKGIDNLSLIKDIEEWDASAVLVYGWSFKSHLKALRYFKGKIPVLFRGDSTLLNEIAHFSLKKTMRRLFLKWVYSHVDIALYTGSANGTYYQKFGLRKKQMVFAPHAVDNQRFGKKQEQSIREELRVPPNDIVFLYAGKFESVKNPLLLVHAFLEAQLLDAHLLMVGNGHMEAVLKEISGIRNNGRIHFIDFQNQSAMPAIYQAADVFVLPSRSETWGLAVNEAMATGRAVLVSSQCGCASDLVHQGENGYIFKSNDKEDLARKMKYFEGDKIRLKKMGEQSSAIIKEYTFEKIAQAIEGAVFSR